MKTNRLEDLQHAVQPLPSGGFVMFLDDGAVINAEATAMLQALHSRSIGGINAHLEKLRKKGPEGFMESFYVGYGHKSIGDCGSGTIFIEGVSMLAAKAIQDWMLYSGQEASTRYIDFSNQAFLNPLGADYGLDIQEMWRSFYLATLSELETLLFEKYPKEASEEQGKYEKAIRARAFDIARAFLPAGATTNLSWHGNLRQFADHSALLRHHPLQEVKDIVSAIETVCKKKYPSSFGHKQYPETENYHALQMRSGYYYKPDSKDVSVFKASFDGLDDDLLLEWEQFLDHPPKTELPKQMAECGQVRFSFLLDFASFRDIQRHRAVVQRMPLISTDFGVHPWYTNELPQERKQKLMSANTKLFEFNRVVRFGDMLPCEVGQYYIPMGFQVPCRVTGDLPAIVYLIELRASRMVHPTLHERALQMADALSKKLEMFKFVLHVDRDQGRFDVKRGGHDIVEK